MSSYNYVGPPATAPETVVTRLSTENRLATGNSRSYVDGRVATIGSARATKAYVDTQDSTFVEPSYYQSRDALNVPNTAKGVPGGVAALDGSGKIPAAQVPSLGLPVLRGPWGIATPYTGMTTSGATPVKIADTSIGVTLWNFEPLIYAVIQATAEAGARPVVEVRIGTPADTTYASQTLVASGRGQKNLNDVQMVTVSSARAPGAMADGVQTSYSPSYDARLTTWLYNDAGVGTLTVPSLAIWSWSAYIMRVAL